MKQFSVVETAKLTATIEGGGFKKQASKDAAQSAFDTAVKASKLTLPNNWADGLTFDEAREKLMALKNGTPAPDAGKKPASKKPAAKPVAGKKAAEKKPAAKPVAGKKVKAVGSGRTGLRSKKLTPTVKENPFRGGKSKSTFDMILKSPGLVYRQYIEKGGRVNTIAGAIRNGWLKVSD